MRKAQELNYKVSRWFLSHVWDNTILTIIATAVVTTSITLLIQNIRSVFTNNIILVWFFIAIIVLLLLIYYFFSHEKTILKVKINNDHLDDEWINNDLRVQIPSIATIDKNETALYIQFMDIPFTLNSKLPLNYILEFKAKIINQCFSWCTNAKIDSTSMRAYVFQYNHNTRKFRPHFLSGYDKNNNITLWIYPEIKNSPLQSIENLNLRQKNEWYFIRTEVREYERNIRLPDYNEERIKNILPLYRNSEDQEIQYNRESINKVIEIKIYDMNDLGKIIYHNFFHEPPFQCFSGGTIGFRNSQIESALYKDIVIKELY